MPMARGGKTGVAHTFFHKGDKAHSGELIGVLRKASVEPPKALLAFGTATKVKTHRVFGAWGPREDMDPSAKSTKTTFSDSDSD